MLVVGRSSNKTPCSTRKCKRRFLKDEVKKKNIQIVPEMSLSLPEGKRVLMQKSATKNITSASKLGARERGKE